MKNTNNLLPKNKFLILFLLTLVVFTLTSCQKERAPVNDVIAIGYLNKDIYLIDQKNNSYLLEGYQEIQDSLSEMMYFKKNNQYGYMNILGEEIIKPNYEKAFFMNENKAVVVKNNTYLIIDNTGKTLFTFPDGITSSAYFSENHLVVCKNNKYGYLVYNPTTNEFDMPYDFPFDYAGNYSEGFAVVGLDNSKIADGTSYANNEVKFNYLSKDNYLLFDKYSFSYAEKFSNGLAKVGNKADVAIPGVSITGAFSGTYRYDNIYVYNYILPTGAYLINQETGLPLTVHYGSSPNDGIISTAVYKFNATSALENPYFKSYSFYDLEGNKEYASCFQYTATENINIFWPTNLVKVGNRHIFGFAKQSISWRLVAADNSYDEFLSIAISVDESIPWVKKLASDNLIEIETILTNSRVPFNMSSLYTPKYVTSTVKNTLAVVQVNINDYGKYGIIEITYDEEIDKNEEDITDGFTAKYLVEPIYDRIVF